MPHPHESRRRAQLVNRFRSQVPPAPVQGDPSPPRHLEVFATGTDSIQLTWSRLGPGPVDVTVDGARRTIDADGGPGAVQLDGLTGGARHRVSVGGTGMPGGEVTLSASTLAAPPGDLLARVATVSDAHLGSHSTGYLHTMVEKPEPVIGHAERCVTAALAEAAAWGATELIVKGDLVDEDLAANWALAASVVARFDGQVHLLPGNHERAVRSDHRPGPIPSPFAEAFAVGVRTHDLPGIRLVLVDTTIPRRDHGAIADRVEAVCTAAHEAAGPALVALHHQPTRTPMPTYLPPGIPGPESSQFLAALHRANPDVLVTAGHTHRHRRRVQQSVTVTEVGSTKDFPGTWAGYEIYEGGIVQVVRRIAEPSCIRWTDWTRRAAGGIWQRWSPGSLDDRCFTLRWSRSSHQ